jgi:tetratricopeptide (TPR) repeat protein
VEADDLLKAAHGLLSAGVEMEQWQKAQQLARVVEPLESKTAADLFVAGSAAAAQAGQAIEAVRMARSGMILYSSSDADRSTVAANHAMAALPRITDPGTWLHEASGLQNDMTAAGVIENGVELARTIVGFTADLPLSDDARMAHAQALVNLASAQVRAGRHKQALLAAGEASTAAPSDAFELIGNLEYARGLAHAELNEISEARAAYGRSRQAFTDAGSDDRNLAYIDRLDAAALARTGRYKEALEIFNFAAGTFRRLNLPEEVDRCAVGIVQARHNLGQHLSAGELDEYEQACHRLSSSESVTMALNLANISHRQHDESRADRLYSTFSRRAKDMGMVVDAARFDSSHSVVLRDKGELAGAISLNRSAAATFREVGLQREIANADNNYALLLEEQAKTKTGDEATVLRDAAADSALAAIQALDKLRHSLPEAADRSALQLSAYPHIFTVAIASCFRAERFEEAAAIVEKSRIQPILPAAGSGFVEPSPLAARPGSPVVGGVGTPVILAELCSRQLGRDSTWLGWWSDGRTLVRARSALQDVDVDRGPLNAGLLDLVAAAMPVITRADLTASDGDLGLARRIAIWRAARGPLVNCPALAQEVGTTLLRSTRRRIEADPFVSKATKSQSDELLWPLSEMLLADTLRSDLAKAVETGATGGIVAAPPSLLGRVPWAALPLSDPSNGPPARLIEAADLIVGLPASLAAGLRPTVSRPTRAGGGVVIADSLGNLPYARRLAPDGMRVLGPGGSLAATKETLLEALRTMPDLLVISGHVRPGSDADPASSALMLATPGGGQDQLTVAEFANLDVPPECVILGCDGAGAATGTEWTGLVTGLVWAGARVVVTTTVPVIEDDIAGRRDSELIDSIRLNGAVPGLLNWQRNMVGHHRTEPDSPEYSPYRWATTIAVQSGT